MAEPEHASLRYLQLQDAFRRMVVLGTQSVNKQVFCAALADVPEFYLEPLWQLYGMVTSGLISNSMAEFDDVCKDSDVARQLEELEGLLLQQGRPLEASAGGSEAAVAAENAARLAAKRHEVQELQAALSQVKQDIQQTQRELQVQQRRAGDEKENYEKLEDSMTQVYQCSKQWLASAAAQT